MYEKYAKEHEQSPSAPEALYDAAWRRSALIEIYKTEANQKKSDEAKTRSLALAQKIVAQYAQSDWGTRAQMLIFYVQQDFPTYGNASDYHGCRNVTPPRHERNVRVNFFCDTGPLPFSVEDY